MKHSRFAAASQAPAFTRRSRVSLRSSLAAASTAVLIVALAACTPGNGAASNSSQGSASSTVASSTVPASTAAVASPTPTQPTPAQALEVKVKAALSDVAAKSAKPSREDIRAALAALAANPADVEVSLSKTPTGLDADAVQGAVKLEASCVVGEVRAGAVSTVILPVLSTGHCFVGDQR
ncbi:DUF6993 domain-containing protein [Psychromicrobium xiongbiense]|uniref:DUF6993 domain-containing protein n=1 Tax=Psychromicrobium xiongbiense TaxID=3051184 RepID=UPI0025566F6D|nr:hypothetical protein [Psychromicrobium sp. YIM S02556]